MATLKETYKQIFGGEYQKETYKMEDHSFAQNSRIGKAVCRKCGLIALNNSFTAWSIRMGCYSEHHPQYHNKRKI